MEIFESHPFSIIVLSFIKSHPILWFILFSLFFFFYFIRLLTEFIPQLDIIKARFLLPISKKITNGKLRKMAIKADIKGHINTEISRMKRYLPKGWLEEIDIKWVQNETPEILKEEKLVVLRMRAVENQSRNFCNAIYNYFKTVLFPKTHGVVPEQHLEASVLFVCRNVLKLKDKITEELFEDEHMEPLIQKHGRIVNHLESYEIMHKRGFYYGIFLRELQAISLNSRFVGNRNMIGEDISKISKHIVGFIEAYDLSYKEKKDIEASGWHNEGKVTNYSIMLVAHPVKIENGISAYINRAKSVFSHGTERLYIFGAGEEKGFAENVIKGIQNSNKDVELVEKFETPHDYRGNFSGVGALFQIKK